MLNLEPKFLAKLKQRHFLANLPIGNFILLILVSNEPSNRNLIGKVRQ